jgi:hypothetical protein
MMDHRFLRTQHNHFFFVDRLSSITPLYLRIGISRTSLLAGNTKNGVHVVVAHVSSLSGNVLWVHRHGKILGGNCDCMMAKAK